MSKGKYNLKNSLSKTLKKSLNDAGNGLNSDGSKTKGYKRG